VRSLNNIDELLNDEKRKLDNLEVPTTMEDRLRSSLDNTPTKKKKSIRARVAALIIIVLLLSYNVDTLAYYGKQLIGYENIMDGTLSELNKLGKGQIIDKSYTFNNGIKVTLDAIMLDDNNLIVFYSIYDPNGDIGNLDSEMANMVGAFGNIHYGGGYGIIDDSNKQMNWIMEYDSPKFYEKNMKLQFSLDGEQGEIKFKLDRNKAMGHSIKLSIDKKIELDGRNITIKSLMASPTSTVIKGQIQNIVELGIDYIKEEGFRPSNIEIQLIADGEVIETKGGSIGTSNKGSNFETRYDALPEDTKKIELKLTEFGANHNTKELIQIIKGESKEFKILDKDIRIDRIYEENGKTYITITTEEGLLLSRVYLNIDGERKREMNTIPGELNKIIDGDAVRIQYTRTMEFEGMGDELELDIQRIQYEKEYDKIMYTYEIK
jgi:hypothetical protein